MRQLLFAFILLFSISIISCSDSGTGPDPNNGNDNEETTTYSVAVDVSPSDAGSISPSAEDNYDEGEEVELQADANDEYLFTHWSGDIDSTSDNPLSLTVDQDYNITANFEIKSYELTINKEGEGSVNERIVQQKSTEYEHGTVVELTAEPQEGYEFVEWQGDLSGTQNPSQITVDNPKNVTAVFEVATYPLSIDVSGEGSVTVTPKQEEYVYGTEVELLAEPNSNWQFHQWDGDLIKSENPTIISIDSSITITAIFGNGGFAGGEGTQNNPYKVSTIEQLQQIRDYPNSHFIQVNNIDAKRTSVWNNNEGFRPIGDDIIPFTGSYDGQNYIISDLYINVFRDRVGLFGFTEGALIENVILKKMNLKAGDSDASGLALIIKNTTIKNCHVSGIINGSWRTGGLVSQSRSSSTIISSSADVTITGYARVGGLVGLNSGEIKNSHSNGSVTAEWQTVGGLVGMNYGLISNSFSTGNVKSKSKTAGGLVGNNDGGKISYSYAAGDVVGTEGIGGLIGINKNDAEITEVYSNGKVTGDEDTGGLIGINGSSLTASYWDTESSNQSSSIGRGSSDGTKGLTTSEMSGSSAKENMPGFDWSEMWVTTDNYPALFWE